MSKLRFASLHLLISASVVIVFLLFAYHHWYGAIFFDFSGAWIPSKMLLIIDVVLGPFLSFIVYKQGKKNLRLDLYIIGLVQLLAFLYGAYTLFLGKPSLVVLKQNAFEVIIQKELKNNALSSQFFKAPSWLSKPQYGYIPSNDLDNFQSALVQLERVQPFAFDLPIAKERKMTTEQILVFLETDEENFRMQFGETNKLEFFLVHDKGWYAMMITDLDDPLEIIKPIKDKIQ